MKYCALRNLCPAEDRNRSSVPTVNLQFERVRIVWTIVLAAENTTAVNMAEGQNNDQLYAFPMYEYPGYCSPAFKYPGYAGSFPETRPLAVPGQTAENKVRL